MTDDPAIDAFVIAQRERRIRGAFRLIGILLTVAAVFVLSIASLQVFHDGVFVVYPLPFLLFALLGELAVATRRVPRAHRPRIPQARAVRRSPVETV